MLKLKERELMYLLQQEMSRLRRALRHACKPPKLCVLRQTDGWIGRWNTMPQVIIRAP